MEKDKKGCSESIKALCQAFGIMLLLFLVVVITNPIKKEEDKQPETYTPEQKQQLMKATNQFVVGSQENGIIKKIDKNCYEDSRCWYHIQIDENIWNTIPFDTKAEIKNWLWQYGKLRGEGTVLKGYYSGKGL